MGIDRRGDTHDRRGHATLPKKEREKKNEIEWVRRQI